MSRLARQPIVKPDAVTLEEKGGQIHVKGQKGEIALTALSGTATTVEGNEVWVKPKGDMTPNVGTMWSLLKGAIEGVTNGFSKVLEIEGVCYRAAMEGTTVVLALGFSHPVRYELPPGVTATVEKNAITISGIDKQKVGQVAAEIRSWKKPEPYKGKGIRYRGEVVRRKVGKKAATAGG